MAEDDDEPRRPTLDDYRALLGACQAWEASTRAEMMPPFNSMPHNAYELVYIFGARCWAFIPIGEAARGRYLRPHETMVMNAARLAFDAVTGPARRREGGTPPSSLGYTPSSIPKLTDEQRLRLRGAIDALAGAVEVAGAVEAMTEEAREQIDESAGRLPHQIRIVEMVAEAKAEAKNPRRYDAAGIARQINREFPRLKPKASAGSVRTTWKRFGDKT